MADKCDQKASTWRNPLVVGVFVAALGLFGNIGVTFLQNRASQALSREKAQSDLILEAIRTGDTAKANANLIFFIEAHLVDDAHDYIKNAIKEGRGPTLPAPVAEQMGEEYWMGRGGRRVDYNEALRAFQIAADQGNARSMANIGWIYENGFDVSRDYAQAMMWYERAANHGDVVANWNIGRL
jgi:TPR repeat protein